MEPLESKSNLVSGRNSVVECQLPKLDVAGSSPVARSNKINGLDAFSKPFLFSEFQLPTLFPTFKTKTAFFEP
jgi:hypothetical protein